MSSIRPLPPIPPKKQSADSDKTPANTQEPSILQSVVGSKKTSPIPRLQLIPEPSSPPPNRPLPKIPDDTKKLTSSTSEYEPDAGTLPQASSPPDKPLPEVPGQGANSPEPRANHSRSRSEQDIAGSDNEITSPKISPTKKASIGGTSSPKPELARRSRSTTLRAQFRGQSVVSPPLGQIIHSPRSLLTRIEKGRLTRLGEFVDDPHGISGMEQEKKIHTPNSTIGSSKVIQSADKTTEAPKTPRTSRVLKHQFLRAKTTPRSPTPEQIIASQASILTESTTTPGNALEISAVETNQKVNDAEPAEKKENN